MANYSNFTGVRYDNFKSFLIAVFTYLLVVFILLYQISRPQEKFKKYTDNPNDYMDVTFDFEIDDKLPSAPEIAKETKQGELDNKQIKDVEEDKIKTTAQVVAPPPPSKTQEPQKPKEEPKPEPKKEEPKAEPKKEEPKPEPKVEDQPAEKTVEKKEEAKPEPKKEEKLSLNDLFSDTTKDNKKLEESAKASDAVQSNKKSDKETATSSAKDKAASKNAVVKSEKLGGRTQRTGEYNVYYGAIEKKLQVLWSRYIATTKDDATIKIIFGADGRVVDYKIIELGRETEFNQKLRDFLDNLSTQSFPKSPDGAAHEIETKMSDVMKSN